MTKEDEKLLLEDLGARMIHGVIVNTPKGDGYLGTINLTIFGHELGVNVKATERENFPLDECKPYLRSMEDMTIDQRKAFFLYAGYEQHKIDINGKIRYEFIDYIGEIDGKLFPNYAAIEWLNKEGFDYRGLIPKGLAIEVTKDNNPYVM